jgi:hypothetical protein
MEKVEIKYEEIKDKAKLTLGGGKAHLEGDHDVVALRTEINALKSPVAASRGKHETNRRVSSNRGGSCNPQPG